MASDPGELLAEIRERERNTVPGPWVVRESSILWELILGDDRYHRVLVRAPKTEAWPPPPNGEFIARARTDIPRLLAALDAALKHHQRTPLYGDASTLENPGACPHDPEQDWDCHFESNDGEWLCGGQPEGFACSCAGLPDGEPNPYPCDEVAAILAALNGKEGT